VYFSGTDRGRKHVPGGERDTTETRQSQHGTTRDDDTPDTDADLLNAMLIKEYESTPSQT